MLEKLKQFEMLKESLAAVYGGARKNSCNDKRKCRGKYGNDKRKCEEKWYGSSGINSTGGSGGGQEGEGN